MKVNSTVYLTPKPNLRDVITLINQNLEEKRKKGKKCPIDICEFLEQNKQISQSHLAERLSEYSSTHIYTSDVPHLKKAVDEFYARLSRTKE